MGKKNEKNGDAYQAEGSVKLKHEMRALVIL